MTILQNRRVRLRPLKWQRVARVLCFRVPRERERAKLLQISLQSVCMMERKYCSFPKNRQLLACYRFESVSSFFMNIYTFHCANSTSFLICISTLSKTGRGQLFSFRSRGSSVQPRMTASICCSSFILEMRA